MFKKPRRPTFEKHINSYIEKHRIQTFQFKLSQGGWGNMDVMLHRIKSEFWEDAKSFDENDEQKAMIIENALKKIMKFYS